MPRHTLRKRENKGFTLVELLLATAIFASVCVVIYSSFWVGVRAYRKMEKIGGTYQQARLSLERIASNLRNMIVFSIEEKGTSGFTGDSESLSFYSIMQTKDEQPHNEIYKLEYYAQAKGKDEYVLYEKRLTLMDTFVEEPQVVPMELAVGVTKFALSYAYDTGETEEPFDWKDEWDEDKDKGKIPLGVKIELSIKGSESEEEIELVKFVYIPTGTLGAKP